MKNYGYLVICLGLLFACSHPESGEKNTGLTFSVSYGTDVHPGPITGRVYVMISRRGDPEPRHQVTRARGIPFWGENVGELAPETAGIIDSESFGFPLKSIKEIPPGEYYVQGFINVYTEFKRSDGHTVWLHQDQWEGQNWKRSPGNLYSDVEKIYIDPKTVKTIKITCNQKIPPVKVPPDTDYVRRIKFQSDILTEFWGQPMYLGATVLLPRDYSSNKDQYYPVNYIQGHFSLRAPYGFTTTDPGEENRRGRRGYEFSKYWLSENCPRMIAVTLQHPCPYYDDSHAVNSPNSGPYGDAILKELIPRIEKEFRIIPEAWARVLSGGSTGGWISLALQIFHPDFFGGTFSLCPDSVDFRAHQIVNIYEDKNAYYREYEWLRVERPDCRQTDGDVLEMMKDENYYELAVGDKNRSGGQWEIYHASWGPIGENGYPKPLWDKLTGDIDPEVAEYWKTHFDLRAYLEKNWSWLAPKLIGKLHIYVGDMDTYYLNNAVVYLDKFLKEKNEPKMAVTIEYGDGEPHCWGPRGKALIELMAEHVEQNKK